MNSQQFEINYNKVRVIIHAYLNSNKSWIANDFRSDTKEIDPMEVDYMDRSRGRGRGNEAKSDKQDKECYVGGKKGHFARDSWSRINQDKTVNEVEGAKADADATKELVFMTENVVKDVSLSQSGSESHEDGLVMIDSGAPVNVCSKRFGKSALEKSDGSVRLRGADGRLLQNYGTRQILLRIETI